MGLHIVIGYHNLSEFKKSRYFRVNLGLVATVEKNGSRINNDKDKFSFHYFDLYKATIYGQGNVGDIKFYSDHYIKDNTIAVYYGDNFEEFIFQLDRNHIKEKGVDSYLGHILMSVEEQYEERKKKSELKKLEEKPIGVAEKVLKNPGQVNYEDLKAYLEIKRKERFKSN
jgi:hypothetical protein